MRSDLLRRIRRLEANEPLHRGPVNLYYTCGTIDDEQRAALAPGERVVKDWCTCQSMFFVRERITTDPDDVGQRCGNRKDWPDEEGDSPRSGESDGANNQQACWQDKFTKELQNTVRPWFGDRSP
jgi:hypothetical protein